MPAAEIISGHMELQIFFTLTNCLQGGRSKRKPDINSPFKQGKALERLAGPLLQRLEKFYSYGRGWYREGFLKKVFIE